MHEETRLGPSMKPGDRHWLLVASASIAKKRHTHTRRDSADAVADGIAE